MECVIFHSLVNGVQAALVDMLDFGTLPFLSSP
jgi:hypothetical protein